MNWHEVRLDEVFATPWKNGGGVARELLFWPHRDDWSVRVSVADIERDGPFSSYPGVARWFAVLSGGGVKLRVDGHGHSLHTDSEPFRFDGGAKVECDLLAGPTQDFNLMLLGREGRVERVKGRHERTGRKGALVGVYSHEHAITFMAVEVRITIPPRTLAWNIMPAEERIDFTTPGALWFEVQP
ncbi:MAG TPA: HutD family protein [Ramlibacter sp.]